MALAQTSTPAPTGPNRGDLIQPPRTIAPADVPESHGETLGNSTITGGLAGARKEIAEKVAAATGTQLGDGASVTSTFDTHMQNYQAARGAPYLSFLGLELSTLLADGAFKTLSMFALFLFSGFAVATTFPKAANGESPLDDLAGLFIKIFIGALVVANLQTIYALSMTLMDSASLVVSKIAAAETPAMQRIRTGFQENGIGRVSLDMIQQRAIDNAVRSRIGFLAANADNPETDRWLQEAVRSFFETLDASQSSQIGTPASPRLEPLESYSTESLRSQNSRQFPDLVGDAARLPDSASVSATFTFRRPNGASETRTTTVRALGSYIGEAKRVRNALEQQGSSLAGSADTAKLESEYGEKLFEGVQAWIDEQILNPLAQETPDDQLANIDWLGQQKRSLWESLAVKPVMDAAMDWMKALTSAFRSFIVTAVSFIAAYGFRLMVEVALLALPLAYPLWLWPATSKAFTASLERVFTFALLLPAFQFMMILVDGIFCMAFSLFAGAGATNGLIWGAASGGIGAVVAICLTMLLWALAYLVAALWILVLTPSIVGSFVKNGSGLFTLGGAVAKSLGAAGLAAAGIGVAGVGALAAGGVAAATAAGGGAGAGGAAGGVAGTAGAAGSGGGGIAGGVRAVMDAGAKFARSKAVRAARPVVRAGRYAARKIINGSGAASRDAENTSFFG